jgi:hypothetical protein
MSTWNDKPNDYEHALAEIARLRAALEFLAQQAVKGNISGSVWFDNDGAHNSLRGYLYDKLEALTEQEKK